MSVFPEIILESGILLTTNNLSIDKDKLDIVSKAQKFINWFKNIDIFILITKITVTDIDFFGLIEPSKLGFLKLTTDAIDINTKKPISSIAFIRGGSVAVLIIVKIIDTDKKYVLLCSQIRFPVGHRCIEACAGMLDNVTGNITGVALKEVEEETGFIINKDDNRLLTLGSIYPSPGGCDEEIFLYAWTVEITEAEFLEKQTKIFGEGEYESIKLEFYPYETFDETLDNIKDVKAECIWRRYLNKIK